MLCELKLQEGAEISGTYETDTYYNITHDFTLGLTLQLAAISQFDDYIYIYIYAIRRSFDDRIA